MLISEVMCHLGQTRTASIPLVFQHEHLFGQFVFFTSAAIHAKPWRAGGMSSLMIMNSFAAHYIEGFHDRKHIVYYTG